MSRNSRLVYSTDQGRIKTEDTVTASPPKRDTPVLLKRESKGRGGKQVTLVCQLPLDSAAIKELAKELKRLCGTGGTVKDDIIEIQGEHREKLQTFLLAQGFKVKIAGG